MAEAETERRLAAIVLGDVVGYSRLMGVDEVATMTALKAHQRQLVVPALTSFRARLVDAAGDAMLMEFGSAVSAVACAAAIQRGMLARNAEVAPERQLRFRLGINLGDIVVDGDKIFGDGINVAARLESLCEPGGLCLSRSIYEQVRSRLNYPFEDAGEHTLKNIAHPVQVYRVPAEFIATLPEPSLASATAKPDAAAMPAPSDAVLRTGTVLNGTYQVDEAIGIGGMGEIFKGHEIHSGGGVAIKVIRPEMMNNETAAALFQKEALALKDITHDAVVRYFSFSFDPALRRHYLAMEFVDGPPLPEMLQGGPLPFESVSALCRRVASGLHLAHERGIVHRDVSSDNIILPQRDVRRAKIIDFGIARVADSGSTIIGDSFAGKFRYASPEQLGLMGGEVTPLSDIYSFGLVLAEASLGTPLEMGHTQAEVLEKRRTVPELGAVDPRLRPLLVAMLQPDPAQRPSTMLDVAEWPLVPNDPLSLTRTAPPQTSPTPPRLSGPASALITEPPRPPIERWIVGCAIGVVFLGALAVGGYRWALESERPRARPTPLPTETLQTSTTTPPPDASLQPEASAGAPSGQAGPPPLSQTQHEKTPDHDGVTSPETPAGEKAATSPAEAPPTAADRVTEFIRTYQAGDCFLAQPVKVTDASATIDSFASTAAAFQAFDTAFTRQLGFSPTITGSRIWSKQCPVLDFLRQTGSGATGPGLFVLSTQVTRGQILAGEIRGDADSTALLLVQEDGIVIDQSKGLNRDGDAQTFSITVDHGLKAGAVPQMLVSITSSKPLDALKMPGPLLADRLFSQILAETKTKGGSLGAAAKLVLVKP